MPDPIPSSPTLTIPAGTSFAHLDDAQAEALSLVLWQLADKPRFEALVRGFADAVQDVEDALWQLYTERWLDSAVGAQLDGLGTVLAISRNGRADEVYRVFLRARVLALRSNGTWKALLAILSVLGFDMSYVGIDTHYPAAFTARLDGELPWVSEVTGGVFSATDYLTGTGATIFGSATMTASVFFRFDAAPGSDEVLVDATDGTDGYLVELLTSSAVRVTLRASAASYTITSAALELGEVYVATFSFDGSTLRLVVTDGLGEHDVAAPVSASFAALTPGTVGVGATDAGASPLTSAPLLGLAVSTDVALALGAMERHNAASLAAGAMQAIEEAGVLYVDPNLDLDAIGTENLVEVGTLGSADVVVPSQVRSRAVFEVLDEARGGGIRFLLDGPSVSTTVGTAFRYSSDAEDLTLATEGGDTLSAGGTDTLGARELAGGSLVGLGYGNSNDPTDGGFYGTVSTGSPTR